MVGECGRCGARKADGAEFARQSPYVCRDCRNEYMRAWRNARRVRGTCPRCGFVGTAEELERWGHRNEQDEPCAGGLRVVVNA